VPGTGSMGLDAEGRARIHVFPDGAYLGGPEVKDRADQIAQIRQFSKRDAERYADWDRFWGDAISILSPYFLTEPPTLAELMAKVHGTPREEVLDKLLTWSYIDLVLEFFEEPHVKAHVLDPGTQEMNPSSAGSLLPMAIFGCMSAGSRSEDRGIPRMGMGTITQAMANSARSVGVEVRTNVPVEVVIVEDGVATGVRLACGEEITSGVVVSNADPKRTFTMLVRTVDIDEETKHRVKRWKTQSGHLKFFAALKELPDLSRYLGDGYDRNSIIGIKFLPSLEYYQQSWDDAAAGRPTQCPVILSQLPTTADPDLVRGDGHVLNAYLAYAAPHLKEGPWENARDQVGKRIIEVIAECAPNFRDSLLDWKLNTCEDWGERLGMTDGNIRHLDMIPSQLLSQRQSYRTSVKNLYMCGAGTHPMGEVTGAPGHNAAHAILKDLQ